MGVAVVEAEEVEAADVVEDHDLSFSYPDRACKIWAYKYKWAAFEPVSMALAGMAY